MDFALQRSGSPILSGEPLAVYGTYVFKDAPKFTQGLVMARVCSLGKETEHSSFLASLLDKTLKQYLDRNADAA